MRRFRAYLVAPLVLVIVVATASLAFAATKSVTVKKSGSKFLWSPNKLTLKKGDTVRWSWKGNVPHNVTGSGFKSKTATTLTYTHKFSKAGTYTVVCTIHKALGQTMKITVR